MLYGKRGDAEEYTVQDGDSLEKLAKAHGLKWEDIALFNWGTKDPRLVNAYLYYEVGCRKPHEEDAPFSETGNYWFSSKDGERGSGKILIPRKWTRAGLAVEQVHTLTVRKIKCKPLLYKVAWDSEKKEIHPIYYPENDKQKVALEIKTVCVPDGTDGSAFDIKLYGFYEERPKEEDNRTPVELPISLLGIDGPSDVEVKGGELKSVKAGDRPALELRLSWDKVTAVDGSQVYLMDFVSFKVTVNLKDGLPGRAVESEELKRTVPVVIFANPDAKESQENFWRSGIKFRDDAKGAGYLALLEMGRTPAVPSVFEKDRTRDPIPRQIPLTHMRGSIYTFYRGHGYLFTREGRVPCHCCKFRDRWNSLSPTDKLSYIRNVISPLVWDGAQGKFVAVSWSELKRHVRNRDSIIVQFELDESKGDRNYTPETTPGNMPWFNKLKFMFSALVNWDLERLKEGLQFCMAPPRANTLSLAAAKRLGGYRIPVDRHATNGPSFYSNDTALKGAPDVLRDVGQGQQVPADKDIYIHTVQAKCKQGEDQDNRRAGFIFWQMRDGTTFAQSGGKPVLCFNRHPNDEDLGPEHINNLDGRWPTPKELMYAAGCLTASTPELAESFLNKGTKMYLGYRVVAWGKWSQQLAEAFSQKVFVEGKTPEQAFNDLKAEYIPKLRVAMWKKTNGGTRYVDS